MLDRLLPDTSYYFLAVVGETHGPSTQWLVRAGETLKVDILFPPNEATLSGVVKDRLGQPISGIKVFYDYMEDDVPREARVLSGIDGTFQASDLMPGKYRVLVDESGYAVWAGNKVVLPGPPLEIMLARTRLVHFELAEASGPALDTAYVSGKETRGNPLRAVKGKFSAEIPETETRLKIQRDYRDPRPAERDLLWPPAGDLDLGRIELQKDTDRPVQDS